MKTITLLVNERTETLPAGSCMGDVRRRCKPDADVLVLNGFPADDRQEVRHGDRIVLIRRGEVPSSE